MNTLDKEEFRIKLEEINHLVEQQDYKGAMNVVDSIDWRRVKNVRTLCIVGEIYAANKRYEDSKEIFLLAYHRAPIGKNILYRLIEVSLKMGDVEEAVDFYEEFLEVAPNDNMKYVLKYKISKARKDDIDQQISILEEYKEREFTERWSYELAKLYHQAGYTDKCQDICNEMSIWFNDGKYVTKARKLISSSSAEVDVVDDKKEEVSAVSAAEENVPVIESIRMDQRDINNAESLQEKISKGIREIFNNKKSDEEEQEEEDASVEIPEEIIKDKDSVSAIDYADVPDLEPEEEPEKLKKVIKAPAEAEKIVKKQKPQEIKKLEDENDLTDRPVRKFNIPEMPDVSVPGMDSDDNADGEAENDLFDFNLEDTILAAASAQGIEIPEKEPEKEFKPVNNENPEPVPALYNEEELTEEDLQQAEEEFLNGPKKAPVKMRVEEEEESKSSLGVGLNTQAFNFQEEIKKLFGDSDADDELDESEEAKLERFIDKMNPITEEEKLDLIPRARKLTDNEIKLFTYLAKVPGLKEQLIDTLCDVQMAAADKTSLTGNIIVMGGRECGKTRLISGLIPAICEELHMEASRVAYVFAEQLNGRDITAIVSKLSGGFLVIENANQMTPEIVENLDKAMEFRTDGLTVIIEDEKIGMRKLIAKYPKFAKKFTSMINIPVFTNDELVNFAKIYTKENGYTIDQMGMLALYNKISESQKEDEPMNIGSVKELIDNAIAKSQGGIRKLKRNISKKRTDHDGYVVLYEKDFN